MDYDVFISCKSGDYEIAEEVYQYLKDNDFHVFLSSKELRRMKDSEYMDAISDALDSAYHLIVLSSSVANIKSKWVKFEWTTFLNELLSERKHGQIMTLVKDIPVAELPIQLRHYEMFNLNDYKERILPYIETPDYLQRKAEAKERLEEEKRKIEEAKKQDIERKKKELIKLAEDYHQKMSALQSIEGKKIQHLLQELGITSHMCPVCNESVPISEAFCPICGWQFSPIHGIPELKYLIDSKDEHLSLLKTMFETKSYNQSQLKSVSEDLVNIKQELDSKNEELRSINKVHSEYVDETERKSKEYQLEISRNKDYNSKLESELKRCRNTILSIEKELRSVTEERDTLKKKRKVQTAHSITNKTLESNHRPFNGKQEKGKTSNVILESNISVDEAIIPQRRVYKTFSTKEELSKFISKFCKVTPNNKKSVSEIKLNIDSFIYFLNIEYGIDISPEEVRACSNYQSLKNLIFNISKQQ